MINGIITSLDGFLENHDPSICKTNYGSDMLITSLADWAELMAIQGYRAPWPNVVDAMIDATGQRFYMSSMTGMSVFGLNGDDGEGDEEADLGCSVKSVLEFRSQTLKNKYPFYFNEQNCLSLKEGFSINRNAYVSLLMISLIKGWIDDIKAHQICYRLFEYITKEAFIHEGFSATLTGTAIEGRFEEKVDRVGKELGVNVNPDACRRSKHAKDDGVDVVTAKLFRDNRQGEVFILVQATCSKDSKWSAKLNDTPSARWRGYLIAQLTPLCILSVPYHISSEVEERLMGVDSARTFIDRIRLVKMLSQKLSLADANMKMQYNELRKYVKDFYCLEI